MVNGDPKLDGMTPEEQAAATAAAEAETKVKAEKEKADAEAAKAKAEDEANANKDNIDWKAELAKEKAAREKAEKELAARSFQEREAKRKAGDDDDDAGGEKPLTARDLAAFEDRIKQQTQKELEASRIKEFAGSLATNDDEANLIIEVHKNRTFPSNLTLEEQLQEAHAIIHGKKFAAKAAELARALKSKDTASRGATSEHRDAPIADEPQLSSAEATALKDAGMAWDPKRGAYKKAIAGGKKNYFFDPKTKKRWTE